MTPAVRVRVWSNAGLPLPGVSVSMALVSPPAGVVLGGTTTAVSDADGIATFSTLSVNTAAIGLSLRATATSVGVVASGTSAPFSVGAFGAVDGVRLGCGADRGQRRDGSPGHAVSEQRPGHLQRQLAVEQRRDPDENIPLSVRMGRFPLLFHGQCPSRRIRQPKRGRRVPRHAALAAHDQLRPLPAAVRRLHVLRLRHCVRAAWRQLRFPTLRKSQRRNLRAAGNIQRRRGRRAGARRGGAIGHRARAR